MCSVFSVQCSAHVGTRNNLQHTHRTGFNLKLTQYKQGDKSYRLDSVAQ